MYIQMNMKFHKLIKKEKEKVKCVCSWLSMQNLMLQIFQESESCMEPKKMKICEKKMGLW
jgi:hypothetical protein